MQRVEDAKPKDAVEDEVQKAARNIPDEIIRKTDSTKAATKNPPKKVLKKE